MTTLERTTLIPTRPVYVAPRPAELAAGDQVRVLVGGYAGDCGRVLSVTPNYPDRTPVFSVYLQSGVTVMGYRPGQLERVTVP